MPDSESEIEAIEIEATDEATEARGRSPGQTEEKTTEAIGANQSPVPSQPRGRSPGPGVPSARARSRSADRTPGAATSAGLMKGKRPDNKHPGQKKKKRKVVPKRVRKAVPKKVRKVGKKGYKKVKKYGAKPVKKFQKTTLGQRIAPQEKCGTGKICSYCAAIILLIASSIGLVFATGNADALESIASNIAPNFDINDLEDPFSGKRISGIWSIPQKTGLQMEIINALDDSWQRIFELAVLDWNLGTDSLELTTKRVEYDGSDECTPVDGKIKVCNADYGQKPWRGLALCILKDRYYANCNAKMNDYFLKYGGSDQQQYTMCHEIGHGFGLPHTDEVFGNPDLGNCMDYTENFNVNKKPDDSNFQKLREFYGPSGRRLQQQRQLRGRKVVGGNTKKKDTPGMTAATTGTLGAHFKSEEQESGNPATTTSTTTTTTQEKEESLELSADELEDRKSSTAQPPLILEPTPPHIWQKRKSALEQFETLYLDKEGATIESLEKYGWKLVEKTLFEEEHMLDLGDGYSLQVQISAP